MRSSWALVKPIKSEAASLFYARLFELDPALKPLFKGDMHAQGVLLMTMIQTAVKSLNNLAAVVPAVQALGRRHVDYGVTAAHYDTVGAALLWALGEGLKDAFTPEIESAWTETYRLLAETMKAAAAAES